MLEKELQEKTRQQSEAEQMERTVTALLQQKLAEERTLNTELNKTGKEINHEQESQESQGTDRADEKDIQEQQQAMLAALADLAAEKHHLQALLEEEQRLQSDLQSKQ